MSRTKGSTNKSKLDSRQEKELVEKIGPNDFKFTTIQEQNIKEAEPKPIRSISRIDICIRCKHHVEYTAIHGECHRNAPSPLMQPPEHRVDLFKLVWPDVLPHDHCGEWEAAEIPS